ncbi:histidine kinase [Arthrobacter livingstonensis]|uniref:Histidine kinase n=1 Tax=Arthrobacter livingstonensis TaxID=670078 RepID=A0A2V5LCZ7_9MICC|nr:helix-turn-helix domain-containing protein [Arthrobacter livingstonensis]PYI68772.1 histidine kinase [Arthrobacter livingstonensis]
MSQQFSSPSTTAAPSLRFSDPVNYSRLLRNAHEDVISGGHRPEIAKVIQESWHRSLALGISPDQHSPRHVRESADVVGLRAEHPLAGAVPALAELLGDDSPDGRQLLIITDALGEVLWRIGSRDALALAESLEFVEGADWSESGIGTNAISEVLRTGSPGQLFSAEHLVRTHHEWACTAAPIRSPLTGELLGVLDVSGPLATLTPDSLRMVRCAVRVAEEILGRAAGGAVALSASGGQAAPGARAASGAQSAPGAPSASGGQAAHGGGSVAVPPAAGGGIAAIELLGEQPAVVHGDGHRVALTLRRAEILALLCSRQQGWSADELAYELYGETGTAASVRIEVHRLRAVLGNAISSNPYRLAETVRGVVDASRVLAALRGGDAGSALALYGAPLVSRSSAVAVALLREELDAAVRTALHADASVPALTRWLATDMGAGDAAAVAALEQLVGRGDPRAAAFSARSRRLENALL